MKRFIWALVVLLCLDATKTVASTLEFVGGGQIAALACSVDTRISGQIAVTECVESYQLPAHLYNVATLTITLVSQLNELGTVTAVAIEQNGAWAYADVVKNPSPTISMAPLGVAPTAIPTVQLRVPIRMRTNDHGLVHTRILYTQPLEAVSGRLRYPLHPLIWNGVVVPIPYAWTVSVASRVPLARVYDSRGIEADIGLNRRTSSFQIHRDHLTSKKGGAIVVYVQPDDSEAYASAVISGWKNDREYAVRVNPSSGEPSGSRRQTRKIWIVLDDHFPGHAEYASVKRLYQEVIDQLRPDDDYDVYQIAGHLFWGWRDFISRYPKTPLDAMAWAMQSNGYGSKVAPVVPAYWILKMLPEHTRDIDVVMVTHDTKERRGVAITEEEMTQLEQRGIRMFMIAQTPYSGDVQSVVKAAAATGGACVISPKFADATGVCRSLFSLLRSGESKVLEARSASTGLTHVVQWKQGSEPDPSATFLAMNVQDRSPAWVGLAGYVEGLPETWVLHINPANDVSTSAVVPYIWADAYCRELERLSASFFSTPSVVTEISSEIQRIGLDFKVASSHTMFSIDAVYGRTGG